MVLSAIIDTGAKLNVFYKHKIMLNLAKGVFL